MKQFISGIFKVIGVVFIMIGDWFTDISNWIVADGKEEPKDIRNANAETDKDYERLWDYN